MPDAERDLSDAKHSMEPIQYRTHHLLAVLDTADETRDAVGALTRGGFLETEIGIGAGTELADRLSETTGRSGFADMAMRFSSMLGLPNEEAQHDVGYFGGVVIERLSPRR